jgi:hypothetical protein
MSVTDELSLPIRELDRSVRDDVVLYAASQHGFVCDVATGRLREVTARP